MHSSSDCAERGELSGLHPLELTEPARLQQATVSHCEAGVRRPSLRTCDGCPEPSRLQWVVDDDEAVYPVAIDPLLTASNADTQFESDQVAANLGASVAGDVNDDGAVDVIVGAPQYDAPTSGEGAAFVFLSEPAPALLVPEPAFGVGLAAGVACLAILARRRGRWGRAI